MTLRTALAAGGPLSALAKHRRFILYRLVWDGSRGKYDKIPVHWHTRETTNAHDPACHTDWDTAVTTAEICGSEFGVGFVFTPADGFWFLDIDACLVDGKWSDLANTLIAALPGAAVEVSVSGTGLHLFGRGTIPPHSCKNIPLHLELYHESRFVALTGTNAVGSADQDCTQGLAWVVQNYFPASDATPAEWTDLGVSPSHDQALLNRMLTSGSAGSAFGGRASFADLWHANVPVLSQTYPDSADRPYDASSADMALFQHLAFWTSKDCARMWRLGWASALRRDKWEARPEYVRDTILAACARQGETYRGEVLSATAELPVAAETPDKTVTVPVAHHLCTDQRNAQRLVVKYGGRMMFCEGKWYGWTGTHWKDNAKEAWLSAQQLSTIIKAEVLEWKAKAVAKRAAGDPENGFQEDGIAETLAKYESKCEQKSTKEAALGELERLCGVEMDSLDANPWVFNTLSGIVDLRTGELRPHDPEALITMIAPIKYDPNAQCPQFLEFLLKIMDGNQDLVDFLQRWFGYCATGSVREQKFAIHHGGGSNGKGTLMGVIQDIFGNKYAGEVPTGMLTATKHDGNRHPTEIADLRGKRLATSSEGKEDETLREDLIKRATGGDRLKGRFMRMDFFEFSPTHKIQLFTNYRPRILGTDYAIWRRVMLIPYLVKFGTEAEVAAGTAKHVAETKYAEGGYRHEREGIFAWLVRGAIEWNANGLRPPREVILATQDYKGEQDAIGQFLSEQCELGVDYNVPLEGAGLSEALYPRYQQWAKDSGMFPLGKRRFIAEIRRAVPGCKTSETTRKSEQNGRQVKLLIIHGVR